MKSLTLYIVVFFLFIIMNTHASVASEDITFRTFSPEGGFYYDGVKDIKQDSRGFMWIIMDDNFYRFDGYEYKSYYSHFKETDTTVRWIFNHLVSDRSGKLLVNTNNGLFQYDEQQDTFTQIFGKGVENVKIDNRNNIWIRHQKHWNILDINKGELYFPTYDGDSLNNIRNIFCTYNDDLYLFSSYNKIFRYNYSEKQFNLYMNLPTDDGNIRYAQIIKGKLWIVLNKYGIHKYDLATSQLEEQFNFPVDIPFKQVLIDKNGLMWIGTINGLYTLNLETKELTHYQHSKLDPFSLPNNSIWSISEDFQSNLWIGTFSGRLCYVNLDEKNPFKSFLPQNQKLSYAPVSSFAEDKNNLWIATEGGGLNCMDKTSGKFTYYKKTDKNGTASNNVKSLLFDKNKRLWISSYGGGLDCLDTSTGKFRNYRNMPNESNSLLHDDLRKVTFEGDSGIWIAYQYPKLIISHYSFSKDKFTHYTFGEETDQYYIFDILRGRDNKLWLLSEQKLYMMNLADHSITDLALENSVYLSGRTMCMDDSGNIWIGTQGNGLIKYEPSTGSYTRYTRILNYNINTIYSIIYDGEGYLWLGTDNGLIRYTTSTEDILIFDKHDGAQGRAYYPLSAMKSHTGELYFGGTNGFTIVNPQNINRNQYKPRVIISDFLIDNIPGKMQPKDEIVLTHNQSNFGFKFSSDNYLIPEKTHFKYRLRGYDNRWIETDASNRHALYSKVPAGTYYFEIVTANNDGVWNEEPRIIKIKRKPIIWLSTPAYLIYLLFISVIIYFIIRHYDQQKKLKIQLYHDEVEKEKKEEIHQSQLRFFTNISHDFRTPLTLIMGVLGKLKQEGIKEYYYRILHNNAQRLLNLVNELMEFRTIENGKMKLQIEPFNVNALIQNIANDFRDYASQHFINYSIHCDKRIPETVCIDKQVVEKIIMNLLNNAFKYTQDKGNISIESYLSNKKFISDHQNSYEVGASIDDHNFFMIAVRDTGIGISKESIQSVFERFYKVDTVNAHSHLGTGIGLALVKSLVLLHKGRISIYSERDKGTDFVVYLPLNLTATTDYGFTPSSQDNEQNFDSSDEEALPENDRIFRRNKKRILVVEDNADLRKLIADFLSPYYEVVEAEDGVEASELLMKMEIDLVISDIMMPRKDGITLSKEIKNNIETSHISVILLTAKVGVENKIEGAEAGADIYFEKPIDFNLLLLSINNIFGQRLKLKEYYAKNYFVESPELAANEHDNKFLKQFIDILDNNLNHPELDVNFLASEMSMSRSKLYLKIKALTDKSIIEFILSYRLRKAAHIIIQEDIPMRQVMEKIGIESQSYFTNSFKKEFGETPSSFATKHRGKQS